MTTTGGPAAPGIAALSRYSASVRAMLALLLVGCAAEEPTTGPSTTTAQYMVRRLGGEWESVAAPACGEQLELPQDVPYELATFPPTGGGSLALVRAGPGDLVVTGEQDCGALVRVEVTVQNRIASEAHVRTRHGFGEGGDAPYAYSTLGVQDVIAVPYEDSTSYVPSFVLIERGIDITTAGLELDFARATALEPRMVTIEGAESVQATSYVRTAGGTAAEIGGVWLLPDASLLAGDEQTIAFTTTDLTRTVTLRASDQPITVQMPQPLDSAACVYGTGVPMASATTQDAWNELSFSISEHPNTEPSPSSFSFRVLPGWPDASFDASSLLTIPGWERGWRVGGGPWGPATCRIALCERGPDRQACATASVQPSSGL